MMWLSGRQEWSHRNLTASNALSLDNFIKSMGLVIWHALRPQVSERRKYQICQLWSDADDLCLFPSRREWISARHDYETIVIVRQTGLTPNSNGFDWVFLTIWFSLLIRTQVAGKSVYHCHIHALELLHITTGRKRPQHFVEETQKFKVATKQNENTILQATHERRTLIVLIIFQSLWIKQIHRHTNKDDSL